MPYILVCDRCGAREEYGHAGPVREDPLGQYALPTRPQPLCGNCEYDFRIIVATLRDYENVVAEAFWSNQPQPPLPELWNDRGVNPDLAADTAANLGGPGPGVTPAEARQRLLDGGWPLPANVLAQIEADRETGWEQQDARQYRGTLAGATNKPTDR